MAAKVLRVRPPALDRTADAIQHVLDLPLAPGTRAELAEALATYRPQPWTFFMANPAQVRDVLATIREGERPGVTLAVWVAAVSFTEYGTNVVRASRKQLADAAGTNVREVSRALSRLADMGVLKQEGPRGRYRADPTRTWTGPLSGRERAVEEGRRGLEVIRGGKA